MSGLFEGYVRPGTVRRAFNFGKQSAFYGYERLTRSEFDSAPEPDRPPHPFPSSLYRAYRKGYREGTAARAAWLARVSS